MDQQQQVPYFVGALLGAVSNGFNCKVGTDKRGHWKFVGEKKDARGTSNVSLDCPPLRGVDLPPLATSPLVFERFVTANIVTAGFLGCTASDSQ
jgi:hypothetical protein